MAYKELLIYKEQKLKIYEFVIFSNLVCKSDLLSSLIELLKAKQEDDEMVLQVTTRKGTGSVKFWQIPRGPILEKYGYTKSCDWPLEFCMVIGRW